MSQSMQKLAERLARIEDDLRQIKAMLKVPDGTRPWWQQCAGMFKDDPDFEEVVKIMEENRRADYEAVQKEFAAQDRKKKTRPKVASAKARKR